MCYMLSNKMIVCLHRTRHMAEGHVSGLTLRCRGLMIEEDTEAGGQQVLELGYLRVLHTITRTYTKENLKTNLRIKITLLY